MCTALLRARQGVSASLRFAQGAPSLSFFGVPLSSHAMKSVIVTS